MTEKDLKRHISYLKMASEWSENSCCNRKKEGNAEQYMNFIFRGFEHLATILMPRFDCFYEICE